MIAISRVLLCGSLLPLAAGSILGHKTGLIVVGVDPMQPLGADAIYKERLEAHGFEVLVVQDKQVTLDDCMQADAMLISASIGGNNVGHRLDNCTTPQLIWEVGIYQFYGMCGPSNDDAWVTSPWWHKYHQDAWTKFPAAPTGKNVHVTLSGFTSPLAGGALPGEVEFYTDPTYGMNWVYTDKLGPGAEVIALLPNASGLPNPERPKAVTFVYQKGAEMYGGRLAPALLIAFPPYGFGFGSDPTCEELKSVPKCSQCIGHCKTASELAAAGQHAMMPLSSTGIKMLDAGIVMIGGKLVV